MEVFRQFHNVTRNFGEVAERFIAPVLKTGDVERRPWVRIPPSPLNYHELSTLEVSEAGHFSLGAKPRRRIPHVREAPFI